TPRPPRVTWRRPSGPSGCWTTRPGRGGPSSTGSTGRGAGGPPTGATSSSSSPSSPAGRVGPAAPGWAPPPAHDAARPPPSPGRGSARRHGWPRRPGAAGRPPALPRDAAREGSARACFQWGLLAKLQQDRDLALTWLERARVLRPDNYWHQYTLAYNLEQAGQ